MESTKNQYTGEINSWKTSLTDSLDKNGLTSGRMIGFSKSGYRDTHPDGKPYFNACIYDANAVQTWWGDLDITDDMEKLQKASNEIGQTFYVTTEGYRSDFNKDVSIKDLEKGVKPEHDWMLPVLKVKPN